MCAWKIEAPNLASIDLRDIPSPRTEGTVALTGSLVTEEAQQVFIEPSNKRIIRSTWYNTYLVVIGSTWAVYTWYSAGDNCGDRLGFLVRASDLHE